ncbi:MAG: efflux RND transporter permease subunit [Gammaproteobacteria bacterium]
MFEFAVRKPVIVVVGVLILCLFGITAIYRVPKQMIPDLDVRSITIRTIWPGATPQDVEQEIIVEQEDYLRNIVGLERMISEARTGIASIELEFPHGSDLNAILIRVNNALAQVPGYPENVDEPRIVTSSYSNNPFMFFRVTPLPGNPQNVDVHRMRDFVEDHVASLVERVPGVSEVEVWGGAERQVQIFVDPVRLAERRISVAELRAAIRARNRDVPGGDIDAGKRRYVLRTVGRFASVAEIEDLVIARRGDVSVRLREVGHAEMGSFEMSNVSYANGRPNITLGIRRMIGANVVEVMDGVMARMDEVNATVLNPRGMEVKLTSEDVQYVKDAVGVVGRNLLIGAGLAVAVLFLFLRSAPATVVGALGIPICTIAAFLGLMLAGRTINVISLAGVAFAIGMTLDNSIVVLENIYRHLGEGKARVAAAVDGVREVWPAVLASTLTTVLVFLPVIFVREEAGQLYSDIAVAISASILMSMLVAIGLVPAATSRWLRPASGPRVRRGVLARLGAAGTRLTVGVVGWLIDRAWRRLGLIVLVLAVTGGVIYWLTPKAEYLPEGEEQKIFAFMFSPPGYNVEVMDRILRELNADLVPFIGDDPARYAAGEAAFPALNFVIGYARPGMVLMIPEASERSQTNALVDVVGARFGEVPGVISFASRGSIFASNVGGSRSINLDLAGAELAPLFEAGQRAFARAREIFVNPQVRPQPSSLAMGQPLIEIRPDWERAAELGIDAEDLGYAIWAFSDGAFVDEFFLDDDKIDMFLYSTQGAISGPQDLGDVMLYSANGGIVPLDAVATVAETVNTETIRRVDGRRTVTLSIVPPREIPLEVGVERVRRELIGELRNSGAIPASIGMEISGANDRLRATRDALGGNFLIAVFISYLLLVAIFSHWGYPLLILTTVPIGISGGIVGLWLMNAIGGQLEVFGLAPMSQSFDVITMLGFLVLIGTVVNNPILLVERAVRSLEDGVLEAREAVLDATRARLRPIMMSMVTTVFGLSPLVLNPGAGTELYRGLGAIVLFGLLFSTLVTVTFMPALLTTVLSLRAPRRPRADAAAAPRES